MAELITADTFPRLLKLHAQQRPGSAAIREKDLGIWQSWSWAQTLVEVRQIAAGLHQAGFRRGEHLAIIAAVLAGDPGAAEQALATHLATACRTLMASVIWPADAPERSA